jgi:hypothetical protein
MDVSNILPQSYLHICCSRPREIKLSHADFFPPIGLAFIPALLVVQSRQALRRNLHNSYDCSVVLCAAA